ncbi:RNA polymerase sigma factor [Microbulbifer variabilis]|uniref:RNA polymerase sigma factor n=1 Tax=Microbulbifer variabilis TaxID=266805 RepID=UPI001CFEBD44|nr:sigma factor-like helix-turn-helix DNA-binding protein [Microbulbifer variabilis]
MSRKAFQHYSDERLLDHYRESRRLAAFEPLYNRHKDALYRYCIQMAPTSTTQLLQTLWQRVMENPPELHGRLFRNWLFIQINKSLQEQTGNTTQPQILAGENKVIEAIQKLPKLQRNVLLLHIECKLSLAAVADIERISLKKCREYYQLARQQIETLIYGSQAQPWQVEAIKE